MKLTASQVLDRIEECRDRINGGWTEKKLDEAIQCIRVELAATKGFRVIAYEKLVGSGDTEHTVTRRCMVMPECPHLGFEKDKRRYGKTNWSVIHIPTGRKGADCASREAAILKIRAIAKYADDKALASSDSAIAATAIRAIPGILAYIADPNPTTEFKPTKA